MIKRLLIILTATLAAWATSSQAQISVTASGAGPITFDSQPPATEWSTRNIAGGSGDITTTGGMDTQVAGETAAGFNAQLQGATGTPPAAGGSAQWASDAHYLITRPTGVRCEAIMATLRNDTAQPLHAVTVGYSLTSQNLVTEEILGHRLYFSTTGAAPWVNVPSLNGDLTTGTKSATLDLTATPWAAGALLYVLWMDDNGSGTPDDALEIDNVTVSLPQVGVVITTPANGSSFPSGSPVVINATAVSEGAVTSIDFKEGGNPIGTDTTSPYSVTTSTLSVGDHVLTAVSHDSLGNTHTSPSITIHIVANTPPTITLVTNNLATAFMYVGSNLTYTAVVTDDGAVTNVDFYVDGAHRWADNTVPYTYGWDDMTVGVGPHTLRVVATDNSNTKSTNDSLITVTNPPNVNIILANGLLWKYWDNGVEPANGDWRLPGNSYDDSSWSNGVAEIGYGDTDANRPEVTMSRKIVGTPGDPAAITNATQLFRKKFNVSAGDINSSTGAVLRLMADDGGVVYINGTEIYRSVNIAPGPVTYASYATATMADDGQVFMEGNFDKSVLVAGENTVAVEIHQQSITSSDISFDLMIWGRKAAGATLRIVRTSVDAYEAHVYWPGSGVIQFSTDLGPNAQWTTIDPPYSQTGGENDLPLDMTPTPGLDNALYFRVVQ